MRGGYRRVVALCAGAGILALAVSYTPPTARAQAISLPNGGFEDGATGWVLPPQNATWVIDDSIPSPSGGMALHLTATGSTVVLTTQYWTVPVEPGATYRAEAWLRDDSLLVQSVELSLDYVDGGGHGGGGLDGRSAGLAASDADYHLVTTESGVAPAGAAYAVLRIVAETQVGGTFSVDGASIVQVAPAPPPPTATPTPSATVLPSPTPTASPTPTPTATAKPASTASPTPTPLPVILPILWNADFEDGTGAWSAVAGELTTEAVLGESFGASLVLRANGAATAWVQQLVTVEPGAWYDAGAVLAPLDGVAAARVRIAWYATATGGGSQIGTVDSEAIASPPPTAASLLYEVVATGPVQAPPNAFTARVRIVLQPSSAAGARLAVDDVTFRPVDAPKPKPTPSPSPTPSPTPSTTVSPTPNVDASNTPRPAPATAADSGGSSSGGTGARSDGVPQDTAATSAATPSAASAAQWWLRITEVMADPPQPGRDADYEWIEITNLGTEATTLDGLSLRDNSSFTPLPPIAIAAGASAVIAGALAEVEADARIPGGIGNGLGNDGDRLELLDGQGVVLDALAYGPGLPLVAPRTGESLHRSFDSAGFTVAARTGPPSPGAYEPFAAVEASDASSTAASEDGAEASSAASHATSATGGNDLTWVVLLAVAGGAVGGAAVQRLGAVGLGTQVRNRFPRSSRISAVETEANPTEREGSHGLG